MVFSCVAGNCTNKASLKDGISLHTIPYFGDDRPEAKKRRKIWVDFVKAKRVFEPSKTSTLCSDHFKPEEFERRYFALPGQTKPNYQKLRTDHLGICVFPSVHAVPKDISVKLEKQVSSARSRRMVIKTIDDHQQDSTTIQRTPKSKRSSTHQERKKRKREPQELEEPEESRISELVNKATTEENIAEATCISESKSCNEFGKLLEKKRRLKNQVINLQANVLEKKNTFKQMKRRVNQLEQQLKQQSETKEEKKKTEMEEVTISENESEDEAMEEENDVDVQDPVYEMETDDENTESEDEESNQKSKLLTVDDDNMRTEPKHIVFLSQLLLLFNFCHSCKADNPLVETRAVGTKAVVTTTCSNPKCTQKTTTWHSQPKLPGWKAPAGNFLLCMAILLGGGSITKVRQIFLHMGLGCVSLNTYFRYQRTMLFPTIYLHWKKYQRMLVEKAKLIKDGVVLAGDGRHDSMGHSAKFCAYTIFCCTFSKIIHFDLVQRNQAGSSPAMESMSFKLCMDYLISAQGLTITTFISDRHASIAKHMKTVLKNITHYFDIWHLKKKIRKVLSKIAKEKDCEALSEWIKPCENHLHWSATSTFSGNGLVIWAKFKSFLRHIINRHSGHSDLLFNKCAHGNNIAARKWLTVDSPLHEKVSAALTNPRLVKGIQQASPLEQTSCLEGFHSVLNHFAPKMIAYCYVGQYCRHILAVIHFNSNLQRDAKTRESDNAERVKVTYPKFKNGAATVRNVRVAQNFAYVQEIYDTFIMARKDELKDAAVKLKEMCPTPMNSMLDKQTKADALKKRLHRSEMVIQDVPPTTPVSQALAQARQRKERERNKAVPHCKLCKHPMKGHKNVKDCPKNK